MSDSTNTFTYRFRYLIAGLFVFVCLALAPFLLSLIWISPTVSAADPHAAGISSDAATNDSPNLVTKGLFSATNGLGEGFSNTQKAIGSGIDSATTTIALATMVTGKAVARGANATAGTVADAFGAGSSFVADTTGNIVGFVADAPVVSTIIKPADNAPAPAIDPDTPILPAAKLKAFTAEQDSVPTWPIHGVITTYFGVPHWPYQQTHTGIDISDRKPAGITPIHPFKPGVVNEVFHSSVGFGNHVIVEHDGGVTSLYGHMSSTAVRIGQKVDKNSVLGFEGSTGASTGPHLHFEIQINGVPVNPLKYVDGHP